uniref:ELK domain-containing protein n=1 Tax=Myripristis murdjan TaxID=586833 RepID=A0A667XIB6_9TELE
ATIEEEHMKQMSLIKQVNERDHQRTVAELCTKHKEELSQLRIELSAELRESMEAAHQVELQQTQHSLELEAMHLSLTNLHSSQLELSQANLHQEQEATLSKVQDSLKEKWTQEVTVLQAQHQSELDRIRNQNQEQQDSLREQHRQDMGEFRQWHSDEKQDFVCSVWFLPLGALNMSALLCIWVESGSKFYLHCKVIYFLFVYQVLQLQEEQASLKKSSEQEAAQLWSQIESMRTSRQELGELKEQLLARSSHVDDIERLKAEFNEQRQEIKEQNEAELDSLRRYFEQRLQAAEENYREEIALLQLRLVEGALEETVLKTGDTRYASRSVRSDLTDRYYEDLQELKSRHAMDLEQLRQYMGFTLTQEELTLRSQEELQRLREELQENHEAQLSALRGDLESRMEEERRSLEKELQEEREKLKSLQRLSAQFDSELQRAKSIMAAEVKEDKHQAELEHQKAALLNKHSQEMDTLNAKHKAQLDSLNASHRDLLAAMALELDCKHKAELVALEAAFDSKRKAELDSLKALFQETSQAQLEALEAELARKHQEEKDELERRMLGNMDTLEATYLKEVQVRRHKLEYCGIKEIHGCVLLQELRSVSARELEACRRELEEESSRQRLHFLEEVELLKVQSEERLQDRISQLKVKGRMVMQKRGKKELRAEVGCLQGELEGKRSEMETLDTLLQRRERESQEGGNLLKMLTEDLQTAKEESTRINVDLFFSLGISAVDLSLEDQELTQFLCESLLVSDTQIHPGGEEAALSACSRLRHMVDTLLELLNQANTQLEQTHDVHLSLEERFSQGREDSAQLLKQHKLLLEQLDQEAELKSQLQLELHKAEGLLEGYVTEKAALEESLQQKEVQEERLVEELEDLKHQELSEEHTVLLPLVAEAERLSQERLDLQRQAEKDRSSLSLRLRTLETELEEQESKGLETEVHYKAQTEDLNQRIQALEKQLKHSRQFIDEQAVEREHERDEFQQEIRSLEAQLKQTARGQSSGDNKGQRVESLQTLIKDKTEDHASLLAANQQAQRDVAERNEEIDKLAGRIRELEQALLSSAESNRSVSQLEQELHRMKLREQELTQDKQALEQQQLSNRLQISALQSKLDETRHFYHNNTQDPTQQLRDALDTAQHSLQSKEREVCALFFVFCSFFFFLAHKHVFLAHEQCVSPQDSTENENVSRLTILEEEREGSKVVDDTEESLPSALLQEKNQEIDHLNQEIQRLEQEIENTRNNTALEAELEELRSQVEHLHSDITRLRQDKQEEEERLHEVISTLQAELATLGPTLHEVSDSQDGDSINPSPAPSPEPHHYPVREPEKKGGPDSLKQELRLTHSMTFLSPPQAVRVSFEQQGSEIVALKGQVEQERVACSNLRRELQIEQSRSVMLEKRLEDTHKDLEDERQRSARQQDLSLQEKSRLEHLLAEAESHLADTHSQLADAQRKMEEERDHFSKQLNELSRRQETDTARDKKVISDLCTQLEQERKQGEELASSTNRLRAELLQSRRRDEKEDRRRREELQKEQEAAIHHRVAMETLREQKQEASHALEVERERNRRQGVELKELKERLQLMKDKEREREEQWERERRKERQEQMERERRQERTNNKLVRYQEAGADTAFLCLMFIHPPSCLQVQRLYERYLRAESFRKSLVYQKRYLLLLLGGFQECEQATLCLIAQMGARPSPPITSQSRPITRFRAAVRAVIAISRMRFLTRKWQRAIRKLSVSGTVNGHASGQLTEFLRQQKIRSISDSSPPKRDSSAIHRDTVSTLVPPIKSPFRSYSSSTVASGHSGGTSQDPERSLTEYIHHLEKVQQRLPCPQKRK